MLRIHAADFVLNLRDTDKVLFVKRPSSSAILFQKVGQGRGKAKGGRQHTMTRYSLKVSNNALGQNDHL